MDNEEIKEWVYEEQEICKAELKECREDGDQNSYFAGYSAGRLNVLTDLLEMMTDKQIGRKS